MSAKLWSPNRKIYKMLKVIDEQRRLNTNENIAVFNFEKTSPDLAVLQADEREAIVYKLINKGAIKFFGVDDSEEGRRCGELWRQRRKETGDVIIEVLPSFTWNLLRYKVLSWEVDIIKATNPFWLVYFSLKKAFGLTIWFVKIFKKNKIIAAVVALVTIISLVVGFFDHDFSNVRKNVIDFFSATSSFLGL